MTEVLLPRFLEPVNKDFLFRKRAVYYYFVNPRVY